MTRKKLFTKTASKVKCKYTGIKLNEADNTKHNSRAFYELGNGEYMSRSTEAMRKYLDEKFQRVEHDGTNIDADGQPLTHEKYKDIIASLYDNK